jgi:hypothetical protein
LLFPTTTFFMQAYCGSTCPAENAYICYSKMPNMIEKKDLWFHFLYPGHAKHPSLLSSLRLYLVLLPLKDEETIWTISFSLFYSQSFHFSLREANCHAKLQ